MPFVEILDGPPEWAGVVHETDEDIVPGPAKDAGVERIEDEQSRMVRVARAARELQRLQPDEVRSWTSGPPFPARTTWIPMIGEDLARIRGLGEREWDFLLPWLPHITRYELCERPCGAPFRDPQPGG
jgi:hypothetical protein